MNIKHELFAQAIIKNKGHLALAYQDVYPSANPESARHGGSALWKKVEIQTKVNALLETHGLGILEIIRKLKELTEAKKLYKFNDGGSGFVPDNNIRLEAIKIALKIHGLLSSKPDVAVYLSPEDLIKKQEALNEEE